MTSKNLLPPQSTKRPRRRRKRRDDTVWWIGGFLFGFMVGLGMSLYYGWVLSPRPLPTSPAELLPLDKAFYIRLIASAYAYDSDEGRAEARLATLGNLNITDALITVAEADIKQNGDVRDIGALVALAERVGELSPLMVVYRTTPTATPTESSIPTKTATSKRTRVPSPTIIPSQTAVSQTLTMSLLPLTATRTTRPVVKQTITRTPTRRPTRTPTPNPNAPFRVVQSKLLCDEKSNRLLKILVRDRLGAGIAGVNIAIKWSGGQDEFFTGFKPTINPGYADFKMEADKTYQINLIGREVQRPLPKISTTKKKSHCRTASPSWQLIFQQGS